MASKRWTAIGSSVQSKLFMTLCTGYLKDALTNTAWRKYFVRYLLAAKPAAESTLCLCRLFFHRLVKLVDGTVELFVGLDAQVFGSSFQLSGFGFRFGEFGFGVSFGLRVLPFGLGRLFGSVLTGYR